MVAIFTASGGRQSPDLQRQMRISWLLADFTKREFSLQPIPYVSCREIGGLTSPARRYFCNVGVPFMIAKEAA